MFKIHFIDLEKGSTPMSVQVSPLVPSAGDIIRLGGKGHERYYKVNTLIWVYDEPVNPYHRVNVSVELMKED